MGKVLKGRQLFLASLKKPHADETLFRLCHKRGFMQANYYTHKTRDDNPEDLMLVVTVFSHQHSLELPDEFEVVGQHDESVIIPMRRVRHKRLMREKCGFVYLVKLQGNTSQWSRSL